MTRPPGLVTALAELAAASAAIGADPLIVQGAGGNVSVKFDGALWIKASGTWLAEAEDRDIMVPVALADFLTALEARDPATEGGSAFIDDRYENSGLKPSVETALHALMPQTYVVHVHSVETVCWSVLEDASTELTPRLDGLDWRFVPYIKPGVRLAATITELAAPTTEVLVLGNHGLVVAADTLSGVMDLLDDVRRRLRRPPGRGLETFRWQEGEAFTSRLADSAFRPVAADFAHSLAFDPVGRGLVSPGTLYPDHAVFLGPAMESLPGGVPAWSLDELASTRPLAKLIAVEGEGVAVRRDVLRGGDEMALCLAEVACRLSPDDRLRYLARDEVAEILDWDAEKYRQRMNAEAQA